MAISDSLFEAISIIADKAISQSAKDLTVKATVVKCLSTKGRLYSVKYQNSCLNAYAAEGQSYNIGDYVYITIPLGDMSNKKIILGLASTEEDTTTTVEDMSDLLSDYNIIGTNPLSEKEYKSEDNSFSIKMTPLALKSQKTTTLYYYCYRKEWDSESIKPDEYDTANYPILEINEDDFSNSMAEANAVLLKADFKTNLNNNTTGNYGLIFNLMFEQTSANDSTQEKIIPYLLEANAMSGNPYQYSEYYSQWIIGSSQELKYKYIHSIIAFCEGFTETESSDAEDDIWIENIEIKALNNNIVKQGDYTLKITTPKGNSFQTTNPDETLDIVATMKYLTTDISDDAKFYYGKSNSKITSTSKYYTSYLGNGYELLDSNNTSKTFSVGGNLNTGYSNKYRCAAVYTDSSNNNVTMKYDFILYNNSNKIDIAITSSAGKNIQWQTGIATLTCTIDGEATPPSGYTFKWSKAEDDQNSTALNYSENTVSQYTDNVNIISSVKGINFENDKTDSNILYYSLSTMTSKTVKFECDVYFNDEFVGNAEITLANSTAVLNSNYSVRIVNGNQVFQYSNEGLSPVKSNDNYRIPSLLMQFYNPSGQEITTDFDAKWIIPTSNTMIVSPSGTSSNSDGTELYYEDTILDFNIADNYDAEAFNNQIIAVVTYGKQEFRQTTNLLFTKVGDNGTNGTNTYINIVPSVNTVPSGEYLTLINDNNSLHWNAAELVDENTGEIYSYYDLDTPILQPILYTNGATDDIVSASWYAAGSIDSSSGKNLTFTKSSNENRCIISYSGQDDALDTRIAKVAITYRPDSTKNDTKTCYGFYPIPTIEYLIDSYTYSNFPIKINNPFTIRNILYSSNGDNPSYSSKQGIGLNFVDDDFIPIINWTTAGGENDDSTSSYLQLSYSNDIIQKTSEINNDSNNNAYLLFKEIKTLDTTLTNYINGQDSKEIKETLNGYKQNIESAILSSNSISSIQFSIWKYVQNIKTNKSDDTNITGFISNYNWIEKQNNDNFYLKLLIYRDYLSPIYISDNDNIIINKADYEVLTDTQQEQYNKAYLISGYNKIYISPSTTYSGEYANNNVIAEFRDPNNNAKLFAKVTIPINMILNTYERSNLNDWDGNSVTINEDDGYVLAPQIGAGKKNDSNQFTGILMGEYIEGNSSSIGLMGFHEGQQSILLDADTGKATFGLPENDTKLSEGRIELVPGGTSKIANWKIGSRFLCNTAEDSNDFDYSTAEIDSDALGVEIREDTDSRSDDKNKIMIPTDRHGIIMSADKPYIHMKGRDYTASDLIDVEYDITDTNAIAPDDSFELRLDPDNNSMFSIIQHTARPADEDIENIYFGYIPNNSKFIQDFIPGLIETDVTSLNNSYVCYGLKKDSEDNLISYYSNEEIDSGNEIKVSTWSESFNDGLISKINGCGDREEKIDVSITLANSSYNVYPTDLQWESEETGKYKWTVSTKVQRDSNSNSIWSYTADDDKTLQILFKMNLEIDSSDYILSDDDYLYISVVNNDIEILASEFIYLYNTGNIQIPINVDVTSGQKYDFILKDKWSTQTVSQKVNIYAEKYTYNNIIDSSGTEASSSDGASTSSTSESNSEQSTSKTYYDIDSVLNDVDNITYPGYSITDCSIYEITENDNYCAASENAVADIYSTTQYNNESLDFITTLPSDFNTIAENNGWTSYPFICAEKDGDYVSRYIKSLNISKLKAGNITTIDSSNKDNLLYNHEIKRVGINEKGEFFTETNSNQKIISTQKQIDEDNLNGYAKILSYKDDSASVTDYLKFIYDNNNNKTYISTDQRMYIQSSYIDIGGVINIEPNNSTLSNNIFINNTLSKINSSQISLNANDCIELTSSNNKIITTSMNITTGTLNVSATNEIIIKSPLKINGSITIDNKFYSNKGFTLRSNDLDLVKLAKYNNHGFLGLYTEQGYIRSSISIDSNSRARLTLRDGTGDLVFYGGSDDDSGHGFLNLRTSNNLNIVHIGAKTLNKIGGYGGTVYLYRNKTTKGTYIKTMSLTTTTNGHGRIDVYNKYGKVAMSIGVDEDGYGRISFYDKDGNYKSHIGGSSNSAGMA